MSASLQESLDDLLTAREHSGRLGEHWPQGPVLSATEDVVAAADYAGWLREVEVAETDVPHVVRCIRRSRVSRFARGPLPAPAPTVARAQRERGRRVDDLLRGDASEEPLAWSDRGPSAVSVDRIAGSGYLAGDPPSDLGRLLTALEGAVRAASATGLLARELSGVPAEALAGWVGDLAAWLLDWDRRRREALAAALPWGQADSDAALLAAQREQAPIEAMLGAFDGQVLAGWYAGTVVDDWEGALPLSAVIERYHAAAQDPSTDPPVPLVADRFDRYAAVGVPALSSPADAAAEVRDHVMRAAAAFLYLGRRGGWLKQGPLAPGERPVEDVAGATAALAPHASIAATIGERTAELLRAGLERRPPPADWPRST